MDCAVFPDLSGVLKPTTASTVAKGGTLAQPVGTGAKTGTKTCFAFGARL